MNARTGGAPSGRWVSAGVALMSAAWIGFIVSKARMSARPGLWMQGGVYWTLVAGFLLGAWAARRGIRRSTSGNGLAIPTARFLGVTTFLAAGWAGLLYFNDRLVSVPMDAWGGVSVVLMAWFGLLVWAAAPEPPAD